MLTEVSANVVGARKACRHPSSSAFGPLVERATRRQRSGPNSAPADVDAFFDDEVDALQDDEETGAYVRR